MCSRSSPLPKRGDGAASRCRFAIPLLVLVAATGLAAGVPAKQKPEPRPAACAVVTFVQGKVSRLHRANQSGSVEVGEELPEGVRISLPRGARITVLWDHGEATTVRGPETNVGLLPAERPRAGALGTALSAARNVWQAVRAKLGELWTGREHTARLTDEPLAVRGGGATEIFYPRNERIRPGPLVLRWGSKPEGAAPYLVVIWDDQLTTLWRTTTEALQAAVPADVNLVPAKRYWWSVVPTEERFSSLSPSWFEVVPADELRTVESDIGCARAIFADAQPPAQLHAALGCVLEQYGLLSEARAEYREAVRLSPEVRAYRALAGQRDGSPPPGESPSASSRNQG